MNQNHQSLADFINRARAAGKTDNEIRRLLEQAGWQRDKFEPLLIADGDLAVPLPVVKNSFFGRDLLFYLLSFLTLGVSVLSFGSIIFKIIDRFFSDQVVPVSYYYSVNNLSMALASLIVAAPVYLLVMRQINRDLSAGRMQIFSKVRRTLIYLALFLAAAIGLGDLIALVYRFVAGEVNLRFLLKVLTILLLTGWVFWYYWITLKQDDKSIAAGSSAVSRRWHFNHAIVFIIFSLAAVTASFIILGSPWQRQRAVRDLKRVSDLQLLANNVETFYQRTKKLPASLSEIDKSYQPNLLTDPQSGISYEYMVGSGNSYNLCATFESASQPGGDIYNPGLYYAPGRTPVNWTHPAGRYCFDLEAFFADNSLPPVYK